MKIFLLAVILVFFSACGYKPSAKYAREIVGEKISTSVYISEKDPQNSVIVKDGVDDAVISVFHSNLTSREDSDTHLNIKISNPSYSPIQYNIDGYVIAYRTTIALKVDVIKKDGTKKSYSTKGTYDFSIVANSVLSDQQRLDAIRYSSIKALKALVAKISVEGLKRK